MKKCKIIVYHYVRPIKNSEYQIKGMEIEDFEEQIKFLKKNYNPIGVTDIIDALNNKQEISDNSILFTFDDGFKDHFNYVGEMASSQARRSAERSPSRERRDHGTTIRSKNPETRIGTRRPISVTGELR